MCGARIISHTCVCISSTHSSRRVYTAGYMLECGSHKHVLLRQPLAPPGRPSHSIRVYNIILDLNSISCLCVVARSLVCDRRRRLPRLWSYALSSAAARRVQSRPISKSTHHVLRLWAALSGTDLALGAHMWCACNIALQARNMCELVNDSNRSAIWGVKVRQCRAWLFNTGSRHQRTRTKIRTG